MGEEVLPPRFEDEDITAAPFSTIYLLVWSTESPKQLESVVVLLDQEARPQPRAALLPARAREVRGLEA